MKLTRTILSASLYLLAPASTFGHREFSKASSHTIDTAGVKLSNPRTSGRVTKEAPAQRDFEITNNSDDTKEVLSIDSFKVMLQPTPSALTSEQISATIVTMKEILMVHFELGDEATELTLISGVDFDDGVVADFMPSKRMLRNGRSLVDGETTAAFSMMKVLGGYANVTYNIDIDAPSEAVLNESVRNILNQHLKDKLKLNAGFEDLQLAVVTSYTVPQPQNNAPEAQNTSPGEPGSKTTPVAVPATLGSMAAIFVALGLGFYAWKKGATKKIGERYRGVKSSLRMHPHKRLEPQSQAEESAVEVCTDNFLPSSSECPSPSSVRSENERADSECPSPSSVRSENERADSECPSPSSVRSEKERAGDKKTIDPADFVVEVGTE